uniref:Uncharacterized protein n=1 Tax=Globodera rostochiensis TaxID=31243 RepID=A0A914H908_GLORO
MMLKEMNFSSDGCEIGIAIRSSKGEVIIKVGVIKSIKHYDRDLKTLAGHSRRKGVMETFWLLGHAENGALPANNAQDRPIDDQS